MIDATARATTRFTLKLPAIRHDFQVLAFEGSEQISHPYEITIQLVSEQTDLPLESLLHQLAFLSFSAIGTGIHGQVHSVSRGGSIGHLTRYELKLAPRIAYLQHSCNQRIFQHKSVPEIIAQVLEAHGILQGAYRFNLGPASYPKREYCTQFDESDLNFIQRLCAVEGIHYHFEHEETRHVLVFGDDQTFFPKLQPGRFQPDTGTVPDEPTVKQFSVRLQARASKVARRDYQFTKPHLRMETTFAGERPASGVSEPELEDYRFPGSFEDEQRGRLLARRALERLRGDYQVAVGNSDMANLASGHFLPLHAHPIAENNDLWLLTRVTHSGKQPQVLEEAGVGQSDDKDTFFHGYRNTFEATPWKSHFRPPMSHRTPCVQGSQSAVVTGPAGEEIHCDEHGRVKVQFHWHREGMADEQSSCWMRVASSWAGDAYGAVTIPRVGMEVVVSFWEGCPDQPYISGCVPNSRNRAAHTLPAHKTRTVFKTLSYPGGKGSNELRIEDRKGAEHIYLHAERDWQQIVRHNQIVNVGHERHESVVANSYSLFKAEEHRTIQASRMVNVGGDDHLDIGGSLYLKTGLNHCLDAGQEIHCKAGNKVVIEAGTELTLSAGGSTLTLNPAGVWLNGASIALNSGGTPATGAGIQLLAALFPEDTNGHVSGAPPAPALANAQVNLMKEATRHGESRCLICEACRENACSLEQPMA
ncbi:type VI secretion system tip protein VgrG [Pseudomonas sp. CDFA 602]|uniref:type VI secretion system Vgr family protein n=1 Tax=Pseudomonas californiensis TaxID=2829823 RepID=UPI001E5F6951|nr:type VI secretion system tip protein VgrG [Pseudomonas californiensis]MCD5995491.1 type VI secretion system tip protein VgrG [Pseudomonas californiensis]MCD6001085.1 type VI secretion system tip protein VgrG [Pseudomonas californiensis]